jgi:hypothetical protein
MPTVTTQTILDRARAISDMDDSNFVSETVWMSWMNQAKTQLDLFIARSGVVQNECTYALTATGAVAYSFSEPLALLCVHEKDDSGRVRRLEEANSIEGFQYLGTAPVTGQAVQFRCTAAAGLMKISLYPVPTSGTYLVTVIKLGDTLVISDPLDGEIDSVSYPLGQEEWIVLEMAKRAITKEEGDTRGIVSLQNKIEQHVEEAAWSRALADSPTVRDSRLRSSDWSLNFQYGPPLSWRYF